MTILLGQNICLFLFVCIFISSNAIPVSTSTKQIDNKEVMSYLTKYGYLASKGKIHSKNSFTNHTNNETRTTQQTVLKSTNNTDPYVKREFQLALLEFQKFMGIPLTGKLDNKTVETMNRPRCGEPDRTPTDFTNLKLKAFLTPRGKRKRREALQYFSRNKYSQGVTYDWYVDPKHLSSTMPQIGRYLIEYGINLWAQVSNIKFQNRDGWNYADIIFSFHKKTHGDNEPFDGKGGVLGHASASTKVAHFDDDEDWQYKQVHIAYFLRPGKQPDIIQTAAHEMGHILGLTHSTVNSSVMYPTISAGVPGAEYALDPVDVARIQSTYGKCWPEKIDSIFSNFRGDGRTYMVVGPYIYLFDNEKLAVDLNNWPRANYHFWGSGFQLYDDIFHGENDRLYYFWTKWYYYDYYGGLDLYWWAIDKKTTGINSGIVGWPGLNVDKIDAGFKHIDGKVYIFRKDMVYRWDFNANSPYTPHYPPGQVETGWPKKIKDVFPGVPDDIDTAFRWNYDGNVYFFKGKYFYIWDQKQQKAIGLYSTNQWQGVCDVIKCTMAQKCRSWALTAQNCGSMCGTDTIF